MATTAEVDLTLNIVQKIISDIESNMTETQLGKNGSLTKSMLKENSSDVSKEKSVLEKLARTSSDEKDENVEVKMNLRRSSSSIAISKILGQLEQMIVSDEWTTNDSKEQQTFVSQSHLVEKRDRSVSPRLSELGRTLVASSSLKTYINLLNVQHRQSIASWLYGSTTQILNKLFHTSNENMYCSGQDLTFSHSLKAGIGYAVRLALYDAYGPDFCKKGWKIFMEMGSPVVYVSPALHVDLAAYLASEFSIGDVVVLKKMASDLLDVESRLDHVAFEKQIDEDLAKGKRPLMVIGVVGSTILGQNDMISRLLEIRNSKCRFWVHAVGQGLAALCLKEPSDVLVRVLSQINSFTVPLALWLGIPATPTLTLHRTVENFKTSYHDKLDVLPWWISCQYFNTDKITDIIENAYFLSKVMLRGLSSFPQIKIFGISNVEDFANQVYRGQYNAPSVLVFKYRLEDRTNTLGEKIDSALEKKSSNTSKDGIIHKTTTESDGVNGYENVIEYGNSLNSWLGQGLIAECRQLGLHMIELGEEHGLAFRFCPLETAALNYTHVDQVQKFIKYLADGLLIIESTVAAKMRLKEIVAQKPSLVVLPVGKWAGVGGVCYVPSIVKETDPKEWNEKQRQQVSHLNLELVHSLRAIDTAFSSGESAMYGVSCVKFGMLSDDKDLNDLINLVTERGKDIEQSQQYMDSLAELIRQGIEAANEDLKRESDARLMQEGVMRQIPLMGSLVNWLSPLDKDTKIVRGRSFDLKTGEIQSTDAYYKHRLMNQWSVIASQDPHQNADNKKASNEEDIKKQLNSTYEENTERVEKRSLSMKNSDGGD